MAFVHLWSTAMQWPVVHTAYAMQRASCVLHFAETRALTSCAAQQVLRCRASRLHSLADPKSTKSFELAPIAQLRENNWGVTVRLPRNGKANVTFHYDL